MKRINDNCEAFDHAIALWYWLSHNYEGMYCNKYAKMCYITSEYKLSNIPSIDFDNMDDENDEDITIKFIYDELNEENYEEIYNEFCDYMDNQWDNEAC